MLAVAGGPSLRFRDLLQAGDLLVERVQVALDDVRQLLYLGWPVVEKRLLLSHWKNGKNTV